MAHTDAPTVWSDADDRDDRDDLVVTREPLDLGRVGGAPPRLSARPGLATADNAPTPRAASASTPLARIGWERSLTLRQKLLRGAAISLLIALTIYLLVGGPAATGAAFSRAGDAINARLHPPKPQPTLAERGYTAIKSPPGAYNLPQISLAPAVGQGDAAWACWSSPYGSHTTRGVWSAQAFYTADGGAQWNPLALPQTAALGCSILADGERPASALVILTQGLAGDGSCIAPSLYLTTDTGATWTTVPWPRGPTRNSCQYHAALQGGAIYLWANDPLVQGTNPYLTPTGRLIVSRDAGQTWALADRGFDDSSGLDIIGFRPGGRILASIADVRGTGGSLILMTSDDYGASWRSVGELPGDFPQVFVSSDASVTDHGGWGRLYSIARTEVNGSPSVPPTMALATAYIGEPWTPIPLPPLPADANPTALSNQPLAIAVGPAATLEVERGIVEARDAQLSPASHLWVWNPAQHEWLLDPQIVPGNLELQGEAWRAGDQIVWMTTLQLGVPPVLQIYTKTYPADLLRVQSSAPSGS